MQYKFDPYYFTSSSNYMISFRNYGS